MTSQFILSLFVQCVVIFSQSKGLFCCPIRSPKEDTSRPTQVATFRERPTIFDSRVLNRVKTLFIRSLQLDAAATTKEETGQKKSIIQTADTETRLHVKIDPRRFGKKLLDKAEENAARKSDIYMNKAIDATALGVAVLKLIFGKDAKMIMKDSEDSAVTASLRTNEFRPAITSWSIPRRDTMATGDRKSLVKDGASLNPRKSDKITQLNLNILKLVKSLRPAASQADKSRNNEESVLKEQPVRRISTKEPAKRFGNSEGNLVRLLSLIQEANAKHEKGQKKSWVLLKVPGKQPNDELGMLTDPTKTEENSSDGSREQETQQETHHQAEQHHKINNNKQQSSEGKLITSSISTPSKTLKSEPVQEVNPVKTDATPHVRYEDSVNNLLKALETTHKQALHRATKHVVDDKSSSSLHHEVKLVPAKKVEEHASSKDVLSGGGNQDGAVVSLDALRQLGQILGLSTPKRISPYTGTQDTLTPATPIQAPEALQALITTRSPTAPIPTIPPPVSTTQSTLQYTESRQVALNRISEQLKMFAERGLRGHNEYRKLHHAMPLKWSEDLASAAEKLAYQAAKKGATTRSEFVENKGYGENVAKIANAALENAGEEATRHWYNERGNFTFSDPGVVEETKAFTQIIWKGSRTLGMGAAKDDDTGELYVVALYHPKGNEEGTLRENVQSDGKEQTDVYASIFKKSMAVRHE